MKLVWSNGKRLEVRDAGPVICSLTANAVPIKVNGYKLVCDELARRLWKELLDTKLYTRTL